MNKKRNLICLLESFDILTRKTSFRLQNKYKIRNQNSKGYFVPKNPVFHAGIKGFLIYTRKSVRLTFGVVNSIYMDIRLQFTLHNMNFNLY